MGSLSHSGKLEIQLTSRSITEITRILYESATLLRDRQRFMDMLKIGPAQQLELEKKELNYEFIRSVLEEYQSKHSRTATVESIVRLLRADNFMDAAEKVEEIFLPPPSTVVDGVIAKKITNEETKPLLNGILSPASVLNNHQEIEMSSSSGSQSENFETNSQLHKCLSTSNAVKLFILLSAIVIVVTLIAVPATIWYQKSAEQMPKEDLVPENILEEEFAEPNCLHEDISEISSIKIYKGSFMIYDFCPGPGEFVLSDSNATMKDITSLKFECGENVLQLRVYENITEPMMLSLQKRFPCRKSIKFEKF